MMKEQSFLIPLATNQKLREEVKKDPKGFLKKNQIEYDDPREIKVLENTKEKKYFALRRPEELQESLNQLPTEKNDEREFLMKLALSSEFRKKFKANPIEALKSYDIDVKESDLIVVEDTDSVTYWVLPEFIEMSDEELESVSGGKDYLGEAWEGIRPKTTGAYIASSALPVLSYGLMGFATLMSAGTKWLIDKTQGR